MRKEKKIIIPRMYSWASSEKVRSKGFHNHVSSMRTMLLMYALVPLTLVATILFLVTAYIMIYDLEDNMKDEMRIASIGLMEHYESEMIADEQKAGVSDYDSFYLDSMKDTGVDYSVYKSNQCIMSTIEGTKGYSAPSIVWETINKGEDYFDRSLELGGTDYFVYFMPLKEGSKVIGMVLACKPTDEINSKEGTLTIIIAGISIISIVVFAVIAWLGSVKLTAPLKTVTEGVERLSKGDTNIRINSKSSVREIDKLLTSSDVLCEVLKDSIDRIRNSSDSLNSAIASTSNMASDSSDSVVQIVDAMQALTDTTNTITENVYDISNNMQEMGDVITQAVDNVDNLNRNSNAMSDANQEAAECIRQVIASSEQSVQAVWDITKRINETNASISKINEMVALISSIASQTNLLCFPLMPALRLQEPEKWEEALRLLRKRSRHLPNSPEHLPTRSRALLLRSENPPPSVSNRPRSWVNLSPGRRRCSM